MSGHSKWANIKHRKAGQDAKRSKEWAKITKEILVAVKEGGSDLTINNRLSTAVSKAKSANMPKDNIQRALNKGKQDTTDWKEITYEGYGPGGTAILVDVLTDNINRSVSNIKAIFTKRGGNLGTSNSVAYLFETKGIIVIDPTEYELEALELIALELPVQDIYLKDEVIIIETKPNNDFTNTMKGLEENNIMNLLSSGIEKVPLVNADVSDSIMEKIQGLIDALEDDDDVQEVYTNI